MLARDLDPTRLRPGPVAVAALLLAACSVLPPAHYPDFTELQFEADFVVPEGGRLELPATTTDLVVHELVATPPPQREQFGRDGARWFVYPAGTHVRVSGRCRSYATGDAGPLTAPQLLPGASHIEVLTTP